MSLQESVGVVDVLAGNVGVVDVLAGKRWRHPFSLSLEVAVNCYHLTEGCDGRRRSRERIICEVVEDGYYLYEHRESQSDNFRKVFILAVVILKFVFNAPIYNHTSLIRKKVHIWGFSGITSAG